MMSRNIFVTSSILFYFIFCWNLLLLHPHLQQIEWAIKNGCLKDKHTSGILIYTKEKRLELSEYVKVEETLHEDDEDQEEAVKQEDDVEQED